MKKKLIVIFTLVLIIFMGFTALYFLTTKSVSQCIEYCQNNSVRDAKTFVRINDGRYAEDYAYWIAVDGDSSKSQEIFIFKEKFLFAISGFDRFTYVTSSTQSEKTDVGAAVGSIQFHTRKDNGDKENHSTLLFYSSTTDNDIVRYEYVIKENDVRKCGKSNVKYENDAWIVVFTDLGNDDDEKYKTLEEIKFYDQRNNLIFTY